MKRFIATAAAVGLLLVGSSSAAAAETVHRTGSKATIMPVGAPAGAEVLSARVTVKKGHKTLAKNKKSYRAGKGTYRVTSRVSYRFPATRTRLPDVVTTGPATTTSTAPTTETKAVPDTAFFDAVCTVTGRTITNRTVEATGFSPGITLAGVVVRPDQATVRGTAGITYTGDCTASYYVLGNGQLSLVGKMAWADDWTEIQYLFSNQEMSAEEFASFDAQAWLEGKLAQGSNIFLIPGLRFVGDLVRNPGSGIELDKATVTVTVPGQTITTPGQTVIIPGGWQDTPASAPITTTSTRTVRVR